MYAGPVQHSLKAQAAAAMQGAFATAAAEHGSDGFGSEHGSELHSAAHSNGDCELHSEVADVSRAAGGYGYTGGMPTYSQQSSPWSSPVVNREDREMFTPRQGWQQQQQPGMPPLSPGLSLAELSTGAPIDLGGSEADSDLLESNTMSPAWQPAAAVVQPAYDAGMRSSTNAAAVAEPPQQQLLGSLMACDSSGGSSAISSSYCASDAEEEEVERTAFVEYSNPAAAGAEPQTVAPQAVQQRQQWQPPVQQLPQELDGGVSWLRSSEGGDEDEDRYLDNGRASFDSDDELPVMRMQGGE
jgi:hypothetical protein